jgi:ABC-type multidrug transport system ATPase subunit
MERASPSARSEGGAGLRPEPARAEGRAAPASSRPLVELRRVFGAYRRRLRAVPALTDVSFAAAPGTITAVVGPNGAGKTTLFRLLLGFLEPAAGRITVGGMAPGEYRRAHGIGYLPESVAFPLGWTPDALYRRGAALARIVGGRAEEEVERARARAGLDRGASERPVERFSRGMARRVALAYALMGAPRLLLLDEPLTGLDVRSRVALRGLTLEARAAGSTVLLASHDVEEVERVADRVLVLAGGRLVRVVEGPELGVDRPGDRPASRLESMLLEGS